MKRVFKYCILGLLFVFISTIEMKADIHATIHYNTLVSAVSVLQTSGISSKMSSNWYHFFSTYPFIQNFCNVGRIIDADFSFSKYNVELFSFEKDKNETLQNPLFVNYIIGDIYPYLIDYYIFALKKNIV